MLTCAEFQRSRDPYLSTHAFYEVETRSDVIVQGNIAHVMSYYASRHNPDDAPFEHGVNSIELVRLDGTWRVAFIMWEAGQIAQSLRIKSVQHSTIVEVNTGVAFLGHGQIFRYSAARVKV